MDAIAPITAAPRYYAQRDHLRTVTTAQLQRWVDEGTYIPGGLLWTAATDVLAERRGHLSPEKYATAYASLATTGARLLSNELEIVKRTGRRNLRGLPQLSNRQWIIVATEVLHELALEGPMYNR